MGFTGIPSGRFTMANVKGFEFKSIFYSCLYFVQFRAKRVKGKHRRTLFFPKKRKSSNSYHAFKDYDTSAI